MNDNEKKKSILSYDVSFLLNKQRKIKGVAILGNPSPALENDPKFQGQLQYDMIVSGEKLALASLATELLILKVANIPTADQPKYTGRGQYPKFQNKCLISPTVNKHRKLYSQCPNLVYWGDRKGEISYLRQCCDFSSTRSSHLSLWETLLKELTNASDFVADFSVCPLTETPLMIYLT